MYKIKERASHYPINERRTHKAPKDNLSRDVEAAAAAGMSYGQYKALHPNTAPPKYERSVPAPDDPITKHRPLPTETNTKRCPICGNDFVAYYKAKIYCSDECKRQADRQHSRKRYRESVKSNGPVEKVCPVCGEKFLTDSHQRIYCGIACRNKANANPARRYGNG